MKNKTKKFHVMMSEELYQQLKEHSERLGESIGLVIRMACVAYIQKREGIRDDKGGGEIEDAEGQTFLDLPGGVSRANETDSVG
jgi:hypothetical protein